MPPVEMRIEPVASELDAGESIVKRVVCDFGSGPGRAVKEEDLRIRSVMTLPDHVPAGVYPGRVVFRAVVG